MQIAFSYICMKTCKHFLFFPYYSFFCFSVTNCMSRHLSAFCHTTKLNYFEHYYVDMHYMHVFCSFMCIYVYIIVYDNIEHIYIQELKKMKCDTLRNCIKNIEEEKKNPSVSVYPFQSIQHVNFKAIMLPYTVYR